MEIENQYKIILNMINNNENIEKDIILKFNYILKYNKYINNI